MDNFDLIMDPRSNFLERSVLCNVGQILDDQLTRHAGMQHRLTRDK